MTTIPSRLHCLGRTLCVPAIAAVVLTASPTLGLSPKLATPVQQCDALAGSPSDHERPEGYLGVIFERIDAPLAMRICAAAVAAEPDNARVLFELGRAEDRAGKFTDAMTHYRAAAERGYAAAMRAIAIHYQQGEGVAADPIAAIDWYHRAAEAGSTVALVDLGSAYVDGEGVPADPAKGAEFYRQAIDAGEASAYTMLGWLYDSGNGVEQNFNKAGALYLKGAVAGDPYGMQNMGLIFNGGTHGFSQDYALAKVWFEKAAEAGVPEAKFGLGQLYMSGHGVPPDEAKAKALFEEAAAGGDAATFNNLGAMYEFGTQGVERDYAAAAFWYGKGVEIDDAEATWALARLYLEEPEIDGSEARYSLFEKAYALGGLDYAFRTATILAGRLDYPAAVGWFRRAAEGGNIEAALRLGMLYTVGAFVEHDAELAEHWFETAAALGDADTLLRIGYAYLYGDENDESLPYEPDLGAAHRWMTRAADAGSSEAAQILTELQSRLKTKDKN